MVGVGPFTENLNIIYKYLFVYKITDNFEHNNRNRSIKELKAEAKKRGQTGYSKFNKAQLTDILNPENNKLLDLPIPENNRKVSTIDQLKAEAKRRSFTRYSTFNKDQLIDLLKLNHLNSPEPETNVPVLIPKPVNKMERVKQYAADKIATANNTPSISLINSLSGYLNMSH